MVSYDDLFQACVKYTAVDYFVGDVIPEKKLANARRSYPVPEQERIVALLDTTVFGSAKTGLAIGETGLHWRNHNLETARKYVSWQELASVPLVLKGFMPPRIEMGNGTTIELGNAGLSKQDVVKLLTDLQHLARSPSTNGPPPFAETREQWMLAVDGLQFGPYDIPTMGDMVRAGQINAKECWAWKEGMPNWERFTQVPALAALLRNTSRPPAMPPPLPASESPAPEGRRIQEKPPQNPAQRNRTVSHDDLLRVCVKYSGNGYYVGETIPEKKRTNARASFSIPDTERVVALLDATVFGSAKDGLAVCTGGIYWHDMMTDPKRRLWTAFAAAEIKPKGGSEVEIGDGNVFQGAAVAMDRDDTLRLLSEIQALIRTSNETQGAAGGATSPRARQGARATYSHQPAGRGATVSPQPDLNRAPVDDLLSLPAISLPNGQKLVRERERRGGFGTVEEAGHFLGLQPHQVERLKQRVTVGPYEGARPAGGRVIDF